MLITGAGASGAGTVRAKGFLTGSNFGTYTRLLWWYTTAAQQLLMLLLPAANNFPKFIRFIQSG
jgi:hypothetical protein